MKKIILLLILIGYTLLTKSQDFKVIIVDSLSNKPISYAIVYNSIDKTGNYSNEDGSFYINKLNQSFLISHIGYHSKTFNLSIKKDTVKLEPITYLLNEIIVKPVNSKIIEIGYYKFKSFFTITGFIGDEVAVYFPCESKKSNLIKNLIIGFSTKSYIKNSLGIDFISIFRINFYSTIENSVEPDILILKKDLVFTSDIIKNKTIIDLSEQNLIMPSDGIFVSIEWVGIESKETKKLITNYSERIEPFITTTFDKTNAIVYERNKIKNTEWKLIDKNNKFSIMLKKNNFYTPRISLSLY